jgi:hypothetical protein
MHGTTVKIIFPYKIRMLLLKQFFFCYFLLNIFSFPFFITTLLIPQALSWDCEVDNKIFIISVYTFSIGNPSICSMKNHHRHPSSNRFILSRTAVVRVQLIAFPVSQIQIRIVHYELMTSAGSWMNSSQLRFILITALVHTCFLLFPSDRSDILKGANSLCDIQLVVPLLQNRGEIFGCKKMQYQGHVFDLNGFNKTPLLRYRILWWNVLLSCYTSIIGWFWFWILASEIGCSGWISC